MTRFLGEMEPWTMGEFDEAKEITKRQRFTALCHHVYSVELLRKSYFDLTRNAAPGIDGETWRHYGEHLEERLQDLAGRLKRGAYRARPPKRAYIPKTDGRMRPIGVMVLEDKILRRAVTGVLKRHLRRGLSRVLVRVPAGAQCPSGTRHTRGGAHGAEGELGA
jgi:retron-type reverse transcriptase